LTFELELPGRHISAAIAASASFIKTAGTAKCSLNCLVIEQFFSSGKLEAATITPSLHCPGQPIPIAITDAEESVASKGFRVAMIMSTKSDPVNFDESSEHDDFSITDPFMIIATPKCDPPMSIPT
jgi:hypothetical protein